MPASAGPAPKPGRHSWPAPDRALTEAYRLRRLGHDEDALAYVLGTLAELERVKGHPALGLRYLDSALATRSARFAMIRRFEPIHRRGQILSALGRNTEALNNFRQAVVLADEWRSGAYSLVMRPPRIPSACCRKFTAISPPWRLASRSNGTMERLPVNPSKFSRETAPPASSNKPPRHCSARKSCLPAIFNSSINSRPPQAQATLNPGPEHQRTVRSIRVSLEELQNEFGLSSKNFSPERERTLHQKTLRDIQQKLTGNQALLSLDLAEPNSYLWCVTHETLAVIKLKGKQDLERAATAFADDVRLGRPSGETGRALSAALFAGLARPVWAKKQWLITGDGQVWNNIPLAALSIDSTHGALNALPANTAAKVRQLGALHSLRYLPGEFMLLNEPRHHASPLVSWHRRPDL